MTKYYDKLIRDRLPKIMKRQGNVVKIKRVKDKNEYRKYLKRKLLEEVNELLDTINAEEIADVIEVLKIMCEEYGIEQSMVSSVSKKKEYELGSFRKGYILKEVSK